MENSLYFYINGMFFVDEEGIASRFRGGRGGSQEPVKHKWVDPVNTDHLFYAKVSPNAKEVIVEATDKWGRVYTRRA